jgi:D-sedoheptulose 7-phosphate isomerase
VNYIEELKVALARLDIAPLIAFVQACEGTLWLAGNGGSASTAQHWACDLSKAAGRRIVALGSNPAVLTAWANDTSYRMALRHELAVLARPDDALLVISCSGASNNLWAALDWADQNGMKRAMLSSDLAPEIVDADLVVRVPHTHYGIIEDCHSAIGHWLTEALCSR